MAKYRPAYTLGDDGLRNLFCASLLALFVLATAASNAQAVPVAIEYQATNLGDGQWSYSYLVSNYSLPEAIREITIYFDQSLYRNLQVVSVGLPPGTWDQLVLQPDPLLKDSGLYDALSLADGILPGDFTCGFAVQFDWLGTGTPGPQSYEVVNPQTFQPVYSGTTTIPEPCVATLLMLAACLASARKSRPVQI